MKAERWSLWIVIVAFLLSTTALRAEEPEYRCNNTAPIVPNRSPQRRYSTVSISISSP